MYSSGLHLRLGSGHRQNAHRGYAQHTRQRNIYDISGAHDLESEVTLLPQPLSPTTPTVEPAGIEKVTPFTAFTVPGKPVIKRNELGGYTYEMEERVVDIAKMPIEDMRSIRAVIWVVYSSGLHLRFLRFS